MKSAGKEDKKRGHGNESILSGDPEPAEKQAGQQSGQEPRQSAFEYKEGQNNKWKHEKDLRRNDSFSKHAHCMRAKVPKEHFQDSNWKKSGIKKGDVPAFYFFV